MSPFVAAKIRRKDMAAGGTHIKKGYVKTVKTKSGTKKVQVRSTLYKPQKKKK
jgi:hypothetical protein